MHILEKMVLNTGFAHLSYGNVVMILVGCVAIYLAIVKKYEPLLLLPIGFGVIVGNIPYNPSLPLGVYDTVANGASQNSVFSYIYWAVRSGVLPPLIFLGIGALTDFSTLISSPKSVLLGAAAQLGIFGTFWAPCFWDLTPLKLLPLASLAAQTAPRQFSSLHS